MREGARTLLVRWESTRETVAHRTATQKDGSLTLRVLLVEPSWDAPKTRVRDFPVADATGLRRVEGLPARYVMSAALGWRANDVFVSIAHSAALESDATS